MNFRILMLLLFSILLYASCEDVVDLEVPDGDIQLVVDGWLTNEPGEKQVLLSTTANYFDNQEPPRVNGALVVLHDESGALDTLNETEVGVYSTSYVGQIGTIYHITIQTKDGAMYQSNPELLRAVPEIAAIYATFKEESAFEDEGYYISIDTNEPLGVGDHYRWKQFVNDEYLNEPFDLLYASDEFVDGNPIIGFEVSDEPLELGDHYRIQQLSISEQAFEFFAQLQTQTAFVGSLFDSPPAALNGNIRSLDDPSKKALGYFGVSAVSEQEIVVE